MGYVSSLKGTLPETNIPPQNPLVGRWVSFSEGLRAGARLVFGSAQLRKGVEIVPSTVLPHMLSVEWFTFKAYIYKLTYCHIADIQEMTHIKDFAGYFPWLLWFGIIPANCKVDIMLIFPGTWHWCAWWSARMGGTFGYINKMGRKLMDYVMIIALLHHW